MTAARLIALISEEPAHTPLVRGTGLVDNLHLICTQNYKDSAKMSRFLAKIVSGLWGPPGAAQMMPNHPISLPGQYLERFTCHNDLPTRTGHHWWGLTYRSRFLAKP